MAEALNTGQRCKFSRCLQVSLWWAPCLAFKSPRQLSPAYFRTSSTEQASLSPRSRDQDGLCIQNAVAALLHQRFGPDLLFICRRFLPNQE